MADDNRGFAGMDPQKREEAESKGGQHSHSGGNQASDQGQKGGQSSQSDNPGNFANRPDQEVEEAARKGGEH